MSDQLTELQAAIAQLKGDYETLKGQNTAIVQALKDKIAAGGASAEELQAVIDSVNAVDAEVKEDTAAGADDNKSEGQPATVAPTATAQ